MNLHDRLGAVVLAVASTGASLAWSSSASAEQTRMDLIVLEIATDDADEEAKALTLALRDEIRSSSDLKLVDVDASLQVMMLSLKCVGDVPDTSCQQKIADKIKADRYLWGSVRKGKGTEILADLHLWQRGKSEVRYQTTFDSRSVGAARGRLSAIARESVDKLARGAIQGTARLLAPESVSGAIFIDGVEQPNAMTAGVGEVLATPGPHWFEVKKNGVVLAQGKGELKPNSAQVISLSAPSIAATTPPPSTPPPARDWRRPVGWGAIAAGGVMLTGSFISMAKVSSINGQSDLDAYRRGFGSKQDICDMAKAGRVSLLPGAASPSKVTEYCDSASTFEVLEFVFLGLGVVSAGAGAYLLTTSSMSSHAAPTTGASATPVVRVTPRTRRGKWWDERRGLFLAMRIVAGTLGGRRLRRT
ncbi:MAG: hypothetical protein U0165_14955 [Polyangiaceae bacterium]